MIHVQGLTKYYGDYPAVQGVSFDVRAGHLVGFLGPNGAGKSTTMRILAGYLTATSGKATIAGLDVFWNSVEVRRKIGYMPESCPLYTDMRIQEYLHFRAGLKGIYGRDRQKRIDFVLRRCWLQDVRRQIIGTLSKGYRQRVGLADALLASPPVLILDEPTAGLDPTQIRETRRLIRELKDEHTVLLSTHILSEVEATCDGVIIISKGRVAAADTLAELKTRAARDGALVMALEGAGDPRAIRFALSLPESDFHVDSHDPHIRIRVTHPDRAALAPRLCDAAVRQGWRILAVQQEQPTLEDLFVKVTGEQAAS